jgi:hypothetical protein
MADTVSAVSETDTATDSASDSSLSSLLEHATPESITAVISNAIPCL